MSHKNRILALLALLSFAYGAVSQYFYPGDEFPPTTLASALAGVTLAFLWYRLDATQRGYRRSPWLDVSVIALTVVALPWYFLRSRGLKQGAMATLLMLLVYLASSALTLAGTYAAYYGLQR